MKIFTAKMSILQNFHVQCADEYSHMLNRFNILFYGYGCKQKLLKKMFPDAYLINCKYQKTSDFLLELQLEGSTECKTIKELDKELMDKHQNMVLICINFDFGFFELMDLKAIQIIGTIENIDFKFTSEDIATYNFVLRDLTTYENYTDEIMDIDLYASKVTNALLVFESVPKKAQFVFCVLLKKDDCFLNVLFDKVKKKLMMTKKQAVLDLLHEFIDHGIVKVVNGSLLEIAMPKDDKKKLAEAEIIKNTSDAF